MSIRSVEVVPWAIDLRAPLATAFGVVRERRGFLVVVEDHDGRRGIGEASPHPAGAPTALARTRAALGRFEAQCAGASAERLIGAAVVDDAAAASGIDMALYDLVARTAGVPAYDLLGGRRRARIPASTLDTGATGYTCAKVKVGPDPVDAVARVAAIRRAAPALTLRADANGAWDAPTAVRVARALARFELEWLEQPVPPGDPAALARVRDAGVRIAADESITSPQDVDALVGSVDAVVLKLVQVGGLHAAIRTATRAASHGLAITVTTSIDTTLGTAAALHLAAALPPPLRACGVATAGLLADDLAVEPIVDGPWMRPPPGPGLGVTIDPARLARLRAAA